MQLATHLRTLKPASAAAELVKRHVHTSSSATRTPWSVLRKLLTLLAIECQHQLIQLLLAGEFIRAAGVAVAGVCLIPTAWNDNRHCHQHEPRIQMRQDRMSKRGRARTERIGLGWVVSSLHDEPRAVSVICIHQQEEWHDGVLQAVTVSVFALDGEL
jgi:hypothetical protein